MFDNDPFVDRKKVAMKSDNFVDLIYLLIYRFIALPLFSIACKLA